jgi:hypothetical protein
LSYFFFRGLSEYMVCLLGLEFRVCLVISLLYPQNLLNRKARPSRSCHFYMIHYSQRKVISIRPLL